MTWVWITIWSLYAVVVLGFAYAGIKTFIDIGKERRWSMNGFINIDIDDQWNLTLKPLEMPDISSVKPRASRGDPQFSGKGVEFGVGSVMGTRSFLVNELGMLTGVVHQDTWNEGENHSVCHVVADYIYPVATQLYQYREQQMRLMYTYIINNRNRPRALEPKVNVNQPWYGYKADEKNPPSPTFAVESFQPGAPGDPEYDKLQDSIDEATKRLHAVYDAADEHRKTKHSLDDCSCGFYAYYEGSNDYYREGMVMAIVKGTGELILGTRGFRAEKAEIVALHIPNAVEDASAIVANYPSVPLFSSFEAMVAEFPPTGDID